MKSVFEKIMKRCLHENDIGRKSFEAFLKIIDEVSEEYGDGWIPCSERLPEEYGCYLVYWTDLTKGEYYEIAEYSPEEGWIEDIPQADGGKYTVIAWQPLPQPYKKEGAE